MTDQQFENNKGNQGPKKAEAPPDIPVKSKSDVKPAPVVKPEKPANCPLCNKPLKNRWYYRNGKYFCSKGCWRQDKKKKMETTEVKQKRGA